MANNSEQNELAQIFLGFGLLIAFHFAAGMLIHIVSLIIGPLLGFYYVGGVIATVSIRVLSLALFLLPWHRTHNGVFPGYYHWHCSYCPGIETPYIGLLR